MNRLPFRPFLPLALLLVSSAAAAVGLGELRGQPDLGERLRVEIDVLGAEKLALETGCFRLIPPAGGGDLPALRGAALEYRTTPKPTLIVRSHAPLREPILQLAVQIGCGHEVSREYMLLASPAREQPVAPPPSARVVATLPAASATNVPSEPPVRKAPRVRAPVPAPVEAPVQLAPRKSAKPAAGRAMPDRLLLSDGGDVGEPSLRIAGELQSWKGESPAREAQREVLRLEFRMLMAMQEQATSQLATAEKLRNMEATLGELQQRAGEFAQRVEKSPAGELTPSSAATATQPAPMPQAQPPAAVQTSKAPVVNQAVEEDWFSEWMLYGVILGALLGVGGWLGWRNYKERQARLIDETFARQPAVVDVDPPRSEERDEPGGVVDLHVEPSAMGAPMSVDLELDGGHDIEQPSKFPAPPPSAAADSMFSISNATVDEHFEANPVMELADIMLSFGRVKGAAQALQEYIDNNPQEALQPWIRLMDVYRMAGMRDEFERVASNLNQHFNVEVQNWSSPESSAEVDIDLEKPVAPKPQSLEDMPRLMAMVTELWSKGDVVGYLYQLLRDNRGGQRMGFALPVVEDILFLIELKETANRMETAR